MKVNFRSLNSNTLKVDWAIISVITYLKCVMKQHLYFALAFFLAMAPAAANEKAKIIDEISAYLEFVDFNIIVNWAMALNSLWIFTFSSPNALVNNYLYFALFCNFVITFSNFSSISSHEKINTLHGVILYSEPITSN